MQIRLMAPKINWKEFICLFLEHNLLVLGNLHKVVTSTFIEVSMDKKVGDGCKRRIVCTDSNKRGGNRGRRIITAKLFSDVAYSHLWSC